MTLVSWRNATFVLLAICAYQRWQSCGHATAGAPAIASDDRGDRPDRGDHSSSDAPHPRSTPGRPPALPPPAAARTLYGWKLPAAVAALLPRPGETLRDYRDRMLPLAELAVAPQRARVARTRDDFATLDAHQRAELDGAVQEAATAIQARVIDAIARGELRPATFKPMAGVAIARDVLDIVDRGNTRFERALTADQRTELASHRFDFADYLLFTAPWENALRALD
jgi:hypothetical protein